ncbi:MAG: hypothetical protein JMDDDDMK_01656 [Acidobacteria bacterium]|nr:hypothetical protein [Acidobacteriota bacterium]
MVIDVTFGARENNGLAARADEAGFAFHLAARRIGHLSFKPVGEIVRLFLVHRRNIERDFQPPVGVQPPFAFFHHVIAVAVIAFFIAALFVFAFADAVVVFVAEPPVMIARAVDVILHVAVRDWRAEKVFRLDGEFGSLADGDESFRRRDFDFEFGLFVFGHFKRSASLSAAEGRNDRVETERRACGQINLAAERSARRERQFLVEYLVVALIGDLDAGRASGRRHVTAFAEQPDDAFEIDLLFRTVNRAVGVDVARRLR